MIFCGVTLFRVCSPFRHLDPSWLWTTVRDYNPCEEMFSYIKYYLKDHDELLNPTSSIQLFRQVLNSAFLSVTESQCKQWISHAGYVVN